MADDASSLRAAALLSLKSKQSRKIAPMPSRSQKSDNITLSYDDQPSTPVAGPSSNATSSTAPMDVDADLEDGEISDSADPSPAAPVAQSTASSVIGTKITISKPSSPRPQPPSQPSLPSASKPHSAMDFDPPPAPLQPRLPIPASVTERLPSPAALAHLRSQLSLTDDEIFEAKVIILDILGWGVPAQYLLDCGISPLAVVVCLSELRLRIPRDLEFLVKEGEKHVAVQKQSAQSTTTTTTTDLDAIEQQRKQELLARRAALQSMKKGKATQQPTPEVQSPQVLEPTTNLQAGDDVDAFLAGVMSEDVSTNDTVGEDAQNHEQMEVEAALGAMADEPEEDIVRPPSAATSQLPSTSFDAGFNPWGDGASSSERLPPSQLRHQQQVLPTRKTTKRPVAADFVEYLPPFEATTSTRPPPQRSVTNDSNTARRRQFGPATTQQRLVIEISDDEDSTDEEGGTQTGTPLPSTPAAPKEMSNGDDAKQKLFLAKQREIELMRERIRLAEERKKAKSPHQPDSLPNVQVPSSEPPQTPQLPTPPAKSPSSSTPADHPVDDTSSEDRAAVTPEIIPQPQMLSDPTRPFRPYISPFSLYSSLASMSSSAAQTAAQQTDFRDSGLSRIPSLASKMPDYYQRYLCSYEYADGVCRDSSCRDVHFRDL